MPSSSSGLFRSRVTTTVSFRRLNVSASQTTETDIDSVPRPSSGSRQNPPTTQQRTLFSLLLHLLPQPGGIYNDGAKWISVIMALICTLTFTYDIICNNQPSRATLNGTYTDSSVFTYEHRQSIPIGPPFRSFSIVPFVQSS